MKRSQTIGAALLLLLVPLCLGCSDDDPTGPQGGPPPAELVSTWTFQSVTVNGAANSLADILEWEPGAVQATLAIEADGDYLYEELDGTGNRVWFESGTVSVDNGSVVMNIQADSDGALNETENWTYTLAAGTLTIQQSFAGDTVVFTLTD